jgi:hypothetical protein
MGKYNTDVDICDFAIGIEALFEFFFLVVFSNK